MWSISSPSVGYCSACSASTSGRCTTDISRSSTMLPGECWMSALSPSSCNWRADVCEYDYTNTRTNTDTHTHVYASWMRTIAHVAINCNSRRIAHIQTLRATCNTRGHCKTSTRIQRHVHSHYTIDCMGFWSKYTHTKHHRTEHITYVSHLTAPEHPPIWYSGTRISLQSTQTHYDRAQILLNQHTTTHHYPMHKAHTNARNAFAAFFYLFGRAGGCKSMQLFNYEKTCKQN